MNRRDFLKLTAGSAMLLATTNIGKTFATEGDKKRIMFCSFSRGAGYTPT